MENFYTQVPLIFFEEDAWKKAAGICKLQGVTKAMLVFGKNTRKTGLADKVIASFEAMAITVFEWTKVKPDPSYHDINEGGLMARKLGVNAVIGIGGGSAMDTAKGIYCLLGNPQTDNVMDHCFGGRGKALPMKRPMALLIMIPTTSGTGSEVSTGAVITDDEIQYKATLGGLQILPNVALLDPKLDTTMPPSLTANSAFDALTHAIESYLIGGLAHKARPTMNFNPLTDTVALEAARLIYNNLPAVLDNPQDLDARAAIKYGAMLAGIGMCPGGLTLGHGIGQLFGAQWHIPHGEGCALGLVPAIQQGVKVEHNNRERYARLAYNLGISTAESDDMQSIADKICEAIEALMKKAKIPTVRELGHTPDEIPALVEAGMKDPLNYVSVTKEELTKHLTYLFNK